MGMTGLHSLLNRISPDWGLGRLFYCLMKLRAQGKKGEGATGALSGTLSASGGSSHLLQGRVATDLKIFLVKGMPRRSSPMTVKVVACLLLAFTGYQWFGAGLIAFKAWLAPILIEHAWKQDTHVDIRVNTSLASAPTKPWPWADTYPHAKLTWLRSDGLDMKSQGYRYVLKGTDMAALAFGPVQLETEGADVLFGHRETHFNMLKDIQKGDHLTLEGRSGHVQTYKVKDIWIAHMDEMYVPAAGGAVKSLMLVTCYPFDAITIPGNEPEERYIVLAKPWVE